MRLVDDSGQLTVDGELSMAGSARPLTAQLTVQDCGAVRRLEEAGAGAPEGRSNHLALETDGEIQVFDVWESQEAFEAFGATLLPMMAELGADPGQPMVARVHSVIDG